MIENILWNTCRTSAKRHHFLAQKCTIWSFSDMLVALVGINAALVGRKDLTGLVAQVMRTRQGLTP